MNFKFKYYLLSLFFILINIQILIAQTFDWVKQIGGKRIEVGFAVQSDQNGNVYNVCSFDGQKFNPINGNITTASYGNHEGFLVKYDSAGNVKKFIIIGSDPYQDQINSFFIDKNGYIYVIGTFQGMVDFDPGSDTFYLQQNGPSDNYLLKLDTALNFIWVKQFQGIADFEMYGMSIKTDENGNIYFTGGFKGTVDFDPNLTTFYLKSNDYDVFIAKLNSLGDLVWANKLGGSYEDFGNDIDVDSDENVYITGYFRDTVKFISLTGNSSLISNGKEDAFILKLRSTGEIEWCKKMGGTDGDVGNSIVVDMAGNIFATGYYSTIADFNPGVGNAILSSVGKDDIFIIKLDSKGNFHWVKNIGGTDYDQGNCIAIDIFCNIYISGSFRGIVDFNPNANTFDIISDALYSGFLLKLDTSGKFGTVIKIGNSINSVYVDSNSNIYTTGFFYDTVDFDPGKAVFKLISFGHYDNFVLKLKQCSGFRYDERIVCDKLVWIDGKTYTNSNNTGTYKFKNNVGCDSLIILKLTIQDNSIVRQELVSCDSVYYNGKVYYESDSIISMDKNHFGCDSITTLELTINKSNSSTTQQKSCNSYNWNGKTYDKSGSYSYQTINHHGCDSIAKLELVIHNSDSTKLDVTTCNSYSWNGSNYVQSGIYALDTINQFGCDSVVLLNLSINSQINISVPQTACDSYNWNGKNYSQSGTYVDTTKSANGCDSITTLQLTINRSVASNTVQTSCDSYMWNGINYIQSGNYSFTTQNSNGCDSIANLNLTIQKSSNSITTISNCNEYTWNNIKYTQSGSYEYRTLNKAGCDSIATLNLTINKADSILMKQTSCNSYHWNNKTYTQSGKYVFQSTNINGCDSIVMLDLTINSSTTKDSSRTICDSLNFLGKTLKTSGHYSFTIPNTQGCDSIINLSLNISSQHYKDSVSNCGSYVWPINGRSYDSSGVYVERYYNAAGCDSTYVLNLIVNKNYEIKEQAEVCKEYLWPVNKQVYTHSGLYNYPFKSSQGCDSILSLDLRINPEFKQIDTIITNSDYLWPVNKQIYPSSGSYEEDYTSSHGCDSIHLLLLTINKEVSLYYPNVIHPGGLNEWFTIFVYGSSASIKVLSIYDRWGELIWQKQSFPPNELQQGWNGLFKGQKALPGVYVWSAVIELQDGSTLTEKGDVNVVR